MIKHLFFDLDNTLWDHRKNAYLTLKNIFDSEKITEKYNLDFEEFHREYLTINEHLWAKIRDGKIDKNYLRKHRFYDSFLFFDIDDFELSQRFENRFLTEITQHNELVDGTKEILTYLSEKKYHLHILSNGFQEVTSRKVKQSGIEKYFQTITSADEINIRKPDARIFEHALAKSNAHISNSMMIGDDWIADIEGGLAFGLKVVFLDVFKDHYQNKNVKNIVSLLELKEML